MPTSPRLAAYLVLSILFWIAVVFAIFAHLGAGGLPVSAAGVAPVATATPIVPCDLWKTAGGSPVYRCVDEEQYIVCYSQSPMLFCVPQQ